MSLTGVVLPAWFMDLSVRSDDLINLSVGYTFIPLMAVLFSAWLLAERLAPIQCLGLAAAFLGGLVFAFRGALANLASFDPHVGFLWMIAVCLVRSLYLVLLRKWDMRPAPGEGLFALLGLGTMILLPGFIGQEVASADALDYSWPVWGSIAFIGVGMGALYLRLISFGTGRIGATRASLFVYTVPLFVTVKSILFLGSALQTYQAVGALLVVGGVFMVSWFRTREPTQARSTTEPTHGARPSARLKSPRARGGAARVAAALGRGPGRFAGQARNGALRRSHLASWNALA